MIRGTMSDEIARTVRLPQQVWDALDREAKRCKRSSVKQLEALLTTYFQFEDVEVSMEAIGETRQQFGSVVATISPSNNEGDEIRRRLREGGMPLAAHSKRQMPAQLEDTNFTKAKRRSQK